MISWPSFLTIIGMLCVTYSTRLLGYFALRNRILSPRAKQMMEAAPVFRIAQTTRAVCFGGGAADGRPLFHADDGAGGGGGFGHWRLAAATARIKCRLLSKRRKSSLHISFLLRAKSHYNTVLLI